MDIIKLGSKRNIEKKSGLSKLAKWVVNPEMKEICVESDPKILFSPSTKARPIAYLTQEIICVVLDGLCFDKPLSARKKTWGVAEPLVKCSGPWICNSLCLDYPLLPLQSTKITTKYTNTTHCSATILGAGWVSGRDHLTSDWNPKMCLSIIFSPILM